jgi:hypothetical protein
MNIQYFDVKLVAVQDFHVTLLWLRSLEAILGHHTGPKSELRRDLDGTLMNLYRSPFKA